jgi:hypothetical protein
MPHPGHAVYKKEFNGQSDGIYNLILNRIFRN